MRKFKEVSVTDTVTGETRTLKFAPTSQSPEDSGIFMCTTCPYDKVCEYLRDPRNVGDPNSTFLKFCSELSDPLSGNEGMDELKDMHPVKGTIEQAFYGTDDIFCMLPKKNPVLPLSEIIDKVCPSLCENYTPEHTNCRSSNALCIMHGLFMDTEKEYNETY